MNVFKRLILWLWLVAILFLCWFWWFCGQQGARVKRDADYIAQSCRRHLDSLAAVSRQKVVVQDSIVAGIQRRMMAK
jgi:uncharacterized membrane protein (DUF106 family)